jgi:hypothetical protein
MTHGAHGFPEELMPVTRATMLSALTPRFADI